jgi:hypothetical protein
MNAIIINLKNSSQVAAGFPIYLSLGEVETAKKQFWVR